MPNHILALVIGLSIGLILGIFTARSSMNRDPIYGGAPSKTLHYVMASIVTAMPITIVSCAITGGLVYAITVAVTLTATLWSTAYIFGSIERPIREQALASQAEKGWTEEDARTSGL